MKYDKNRDRSLVLYPEHLDGRKITSWLLNSKVQLQPPFALGERTRLTFDFGEKFWRCSGPLKLHTGIDIGSCRGAALLAPAPMIIRRSGWDRFGGGFIFGELIDPSTPDAVFLRMFHVGKKLVEVGQRVEAGEVIGKMTPDSGSNSTGHHLHIEMLYGKRWPDPWKYAINPRPLADGIAWARAIRGYDE